ncbi:hypothetical protein ACQPW1_22765 [Nocardia sp. CA-128927]|uniref:hypothetical protein n=1 Tax=Nocardia sp. CA-128927 TaxID=3239975 RepID=UPI003D999CBA
MKPASLDMGVLDEVLSENNLEKVLSSDVGAGINLAEFSALEDFYCGIALLPAESSNNGARAAIFVEIGIATARGIPILVIVDPNEPPLPALGGLQVIRAALDNYAALEFHIRLFALGAPDSRGPAPESFDVALVDRPIKIFVPRGRGKSSQIDDLLNEYAKLGSKIMWTGHGQREGRIAELLDDLLTEQGAIVQREVRDQDGGVVDIAFTHPRIRETVLVEVKDAEDESSIDSAREQLYRYVCHNDQAFGLLLFRGTGERFTPEVSPDFPLIWAMEIGDFSRKVSRQELGEFLRQTRNRLVHG